MAKGRPKIVAPRSAHPGFNRAADNFDLEVVHIPVGHDLRADVEAMEEAIDSDTIALAGSAPGWPYGLIDPIPAIESLALKRHLGAISTPVSAGFYRSSTAHAIPTLSP